MLLLLLLLAFGPGLLISIYFYRTDARGKVTRHHLVMSFIWGMLATVPALAVEYVTQNYRYATFTGTLFSTFILTALVEELSRFIAIRFYAFQQIDFDEPLDGIIYGLVVSMGFATVENIFYVLEQGVSAGMERSYTAIPAHATFGIIMGYYAGLAKMDPLRSRQLCIRGILLATLFHGFYDFFVFINRYEWMGNEIIDPVSNLVFYTGAIITLVISVLFARRLLLRHRKTSERLLQSQPEITFRVAGENDISLIRNLAKQIWPSTYAAILPPQQIHYMMQKMYSADALRRQMNDRHRFVIVYNAGVPIGFASYNETGPRMWKLQKIYLSPRQQGRGIGQMVIRYVHNAVQEKGATSLQLNVNRNNPARLFYERLGFIIIRTEDIDIGSGFYMNDYVMESRIS